MNWVIRIQIMGDRNGILELNTQYFHVTFVQLIKRVTVSIL